MTVTVLASRRYTILQDLSFATLGFSGIPQDTRLMFKTFAGMDSVKVTGLLSEMMGGHSTSISTKMHPSRPALDYLEASRFMMSATGLPIKPAPRFLGRPRMMLSRAARALSTFDTRPVPHGLYEDAIWRIYFQKTLGSSDRTLVAAQDFRLTNFNTGIVNDRLRLPIFNAPRLKTDGFDFFVTSDPRPIRTSPGTTLILRYHDPIPLTHPDTMENPDAVRFHFLQIERSQPFGYFVCNSKATEEALVDIFPSLKSRATTIPYALPDAPPPPARAIPVEEIIRTRLSFASLGDEKQPTTLHKSILKRASLEKPFRYIMWLTSLEPKKNTIGVIRAWERVKYTLAPDLKLVLVGKPAWRYQEILTAIKPRFLEGELLHLEDLPFVEIQSLYRNAECFVFPSFAEGFGFPPMEALQCGTPSVVSDIPAHRWVMQDAVLYADPYDDAQVADQIRRLVIAEDRKQLREKLIASGQRVLRRYEPQRVGEQWQELFSRLKRDGVLAHPAELPATGHAEAAHAG
jgi:glycosyltransferase involved in cell wall biosynthesis